MPSNYLMLCYPLLLPSVFPRIRVFSNESVLLIRWPTYWSFSISPSNEYSGFISFMIDWFDLAFQGTLKSLLQHQIKSIKFSELSLLYCPTFTFILDNWENHSFDYTDLCRQSRCVIAFLPRSKHLLISWLQSPSAVILEPKKINSVTASTFSRFICHEVMESDSMILVF